MRTELPKSFAMLNLRPIDPNDYLALEDGQRIGRIRLSNERTPPIWSWSVNVRLPGPPYGSAENLAQAKEAFRSAWETFKGEARCREAWAAAYETMNHANRPERYGR
jgi:hypothetical protein